MTTDRDQQLSGVWMAPAGSRVEVSEIDRGWNVAVYMRRNGGSPVGSDVFTDRDDLVNKLRKLEADGYIRQQAGVAPPSPPATETAGIVMIAFGAVVFVFILLILLL